MNCIECNVLLTDENKAFQRKLCIKCFRLYMNSAQKQFRIKKKENNPIKKWVDNAFYGSRNRSIKNNIPFNLTKEFIYSLIEDICPVLGYKLDYASIGTSPNSSSLDRINAQLGYVVGNVKIISLKANIK